MKTKKFTLKDLENFIDIEKNLLRIMQSSLTFLWSPKALLSHLIYLFKNVTDIFK